MTMCYPLARDVDPPSTLALIDLDSGRLVIDPPAAWMPRGLIPRVAMRAMLLAAVLSPRALAASSAPHNPAACRSPETSMTP